MQFVRPTYLLLVCTALVALLALPAAAYPSLNGNYYRAAERTYDPDEVMDFLNRLSNAIRMERKLDNINGITSEKRGFDLGLNRGYSGNIQAAHLLGVAAAGYSGGPGRRRRDVSNH